MAWSKVSFQRWLQSNWRWAALNLTALASLLYVMTQGNREWYGSEDGFDPMLESGKWAIRFLLISLLMTPLYTYLRWHYALKLRKPAGLWAFAFGAIHVLYYGVETWQPQGGYPLGPTPLPWLRWPMQHYIALGLVALTILSALAITSNKWSMRRLGKNWKRLHRLVYGVGVIIIVHALLASTMSKRMMIRDPQAERELKLYLAALIILLIVRIPFVRASLLRLIVSFKGEAKPSVPAAVPAIPTPVPNRTSPRLPLPPTLQAPKPIISPDKIAGDLPDEANELEREVAY